MLCHPRGVVCTLGTFGSDNLCTNFLQKFAKIRQFCKFYPPILTGSKRGGKGAYTVYPPTVGITPLLLRAGGGSFFGGGGEY